MQLGTLCGDTPPAELNIGRPPIFPTPDTAVLHCDPAAAPGSGDGSRSRPFGSVAEAVGAAAGMPGSTIVLRGGVYHERMMVLGPEHSGLTIQNCKATPITARDHVNSCCSRRSAVEGLLQCTTSSKRPYEPSPGGGLSSYLSPLGTEGR